MYLVTTTSTMVIKDVQFQLQEYEQIRGLENPEIIFAIMAIRHSPFAKDLLPSLSFLTSAAMLSLTGLLMALYFTYMKNAFSINSILQTYARHSQRNECFAYWCSNYQNCNTQLLNIHKFSMNNLFNLVRRFTRDLRKKD